MSRVHYTDINALRDFYFEDSYLLAIIISPGKIIFQVDLVLTESHVDYERPLSGNQYCYKRAEVEFSALQSINKLVFCNDVAIDADSEEDFGNIDTIFLDQGNRFFIAGPWGQMELVAADVTVNLIAEDRPSAHP